MTLYIGSLWYDSDETYKPLTAVLTGLRIKKSTRTFKKKKLGHIDKG